MKRIGIYGGSFDPPHIGHIQAAQAALNKLRLDEVILIPANEAPHKLRPGCTAGAEHRLQMLRLSIEGNAHFSVSDMEIARGDASYTCDTIRELRKKYPKAELYLIMGSDMLCSLTEWKDSKYILKNVRPVVVRRGEKREAALIQNMIERLDCGICEIDNDPCAISSTQLRRMLAFGFGDDFLPKGVGAYIRENALYDTSADWKQLPMDRLESVVVRYLNPNRVRHVLGCRDAAVDLARRWGADETDAARAGILHDITKALDGPLQLTLCKAYGKILDDFSQKYPKTLHALTGSLVAERIFGENERVVSAICSHTTGKADMNLLETIIYVADYMEPNRDFPGVDRLRSLAYSDIYSALRLGLEMTLDHLKDQGNEVSPMSQEALAFLDSHYPKKGSC